MTAPTLEQLPVRVPGATLPPPLIHIACLICDPSQTFCGLEAAMFPHRSPNGVGSCVVCADLDEAHDWDSHDREQP